MMDSQTAKMGTLSIVGIKTKNEDTRRFCWQAKNDPKRCTATVRTQEKKDICETLALM